MSVLEKGVDFVSEGGFLYEAYTLVLQFAILEKENGGDVTDTVAGSDGGAFLYIGFADGAATVVFGGDLIDDGGKGLAGTAPGGTKVDHDDGIGGKDFVEILFCDVDFHDV